MEEKGGETATPPTISARHRRRVSVRSFVFLVRGTGNMASSKKIIFLLSPAKSLNFAAHSFSKLPHSHPCFLKNTDTLLKELKQLSKGSLKTLLGVSDHLATLNHDRYRSFKLSKTASSAKPTEDEFKQCILAYNGAAYDGLDATSMSKEDLIYCNIQHCRRLKDSLSEKNLVARL